MSLDLRDLTLQSANDLTELQSRRDEHKKVNLLLEAMGLTSLRRDLIDHANNESGRRRLTFSAFHNHVDGFPLRLAFHLLFGLESELNCSFEWLMKQPQRSLIFRRWLALRKELAETDCLDDRPVGLVFPLGKIPGGLIIHNSRFRLRSASLPSRCFIFDHDDSTLRIERYRDLLFAIKNSGWQPGGPRRTPLRPILAPPILRRITGAPQKLVAQFLVNVLNGNVEKRPDWAARRQLITRVHGQRWIALTQQEIGDALGLTTDQVRRALRNLRQQRHIETATSGAENIYRFIVPSDEIGSI